MVGQKLPSFESELEGYALQHALGIGPTVGRLVMQGMIDWETAAGIAGYCNVVHSIEVCYPRFGHLNEVIIIRILDKHIKMNLSNKNSLYRRQLSGSKDPCVRSELSRNRLAVLKRRFLGKLALTFCRIRKCLLKLYSRNDPNLLELIQKH